MRKRTIKKIIIAAIISAELSSWATRIYMINTAQGWMGRFSYQFPENGKCKSSKDIYLTGADRRK